MIIYVLIAVVGLRFYGVVDISWATLVLVFVIWLQRGKDWMDIDSAIRRANGRIDDLDEEIKTVKKKIYKNSKHIDTIARPEKLFRKIEEKVVLEGGLSNLIEEEVNFLFNETKDINRKNNIIIKDNEVRNKEDLHKKYTSFLQSCEFESKEVEDIIIDGTTPLSITDKEFIIEVMNKNITDDIEDIIYKNVMEQYNRKIEFKIGGDIFFKSKKNKYREDYLFHKHKHRDELALNLKGEKNISKIWDTFLVYVARASFVIEDELKTKIFLDKVEKHFWYISAYTDTLPSYIDVEKEFYDFFGENVEIIFSNSDK